VRCLISCWPVTGSNTHLNCNIEYEVTNAHKAVAAPVVAAATHCKVQYASTCTFSSKLVRATAFVSVVLLVNLPHA
jgi:hypothetical protein